jgi:hypothetical protein
VVEAATAATPDGRGEVTMTVFDDHTAMYAFDHPELPDRCEVRLRRNARQAQYTLSEMERLLAATFNAALADGSRISEPGETGTTWMKMKHLPGGWVLVVRVQHGPPRWVWPKLYVGRERDGRSVDGRTWFLMTGWQFTAVQLWLSDRARGLRP